MPPDSPGGTSPLAELDALVETGVILAALVDGTPDMVWAVDAEQFRILFFNRALRDHFRNLRGREIRPGMLPTELLPTEEEAEKWRGHYRRALRDGPFVLEQQTVAAEVFLELHFGLLDLQGRIFGVSVFGRNVTERRRALDQLRRSEAFLRAVQEASPDLVTVFGADGHPRFISAACHAMLGYTVEEAMAIPRPVLIHPDDVGRIELALQRVLANPGVVERQRYRVRHRDGGWRLLEGVARNELANPDVAGVLVNARDVTEQVLLSTRLQEVREEEKTRIARDLHDQLGQLLTALNLDLLWLEEQLEAMDPVPAVNTLVERAVEASRLSEQLTTEVQRIATDLRPAALDRLGLGPALQQVARAFEARTGVACWVAVASPPPSLPARTVTALYRIAQEALTNVARHARASQVVVRLEAGSRDVTLTVEDDGTGLDPARAEEARALGLAGMRERASLAGGELLLDRRPGGGTRVSARLPLRPPEREGP